MTAPVFRLVVPLELAPTHNVHYGLPTWKRIAIRKRIDAAIVACQQWPAARMRIVRAPSKAKGKRGRVVDGGTSRRRRVVLTRASSQEPDDITIDTMGGKMLLDCLVRGDVLRDDSRQWCAREARWERVAPGAGFCRIEVFEIEPEGTR